MWKHTISGQYSVKSAYFIELLEERKQKPSVSSGEGDIVWKKLWRTKIQPKVKLFGWKILHNGVLVRDNLVKRGMKVEQASTRCGEENESIEHMLMFCEDSRCVWYTSPLRLDVEKARGGTSRDWLDALDWSNKEDA